MTGATTSVGNRDQSTIEAAWYKTSEILGCGDQKTSNAAQVLQCMIKRSAKEILTASIQASKEVQAGLPEVANLYAGITGIFGPTIDISRTLN